VQVRVGLEGCRIVRLPVARVRPLLVLSTLLAAVHGAVVARVCHDLVRVGRRGGELGGLDVCGVVGAGLHGSPTPLGHLGGCVGVEVIPGGALPHERRGVLERVHLLLALHPRGGVALVRGLVGGTEVVERGGGPRHGEQSRVWGR
jgi:hypothetical protein